MSIFNKNKVDGFFLKNHSFLNKLKRFSNVNDSNHFIEIVKKLFNTDMQDMLLTFFEVKTIPKNTIFCSGDAENNHSNNFITFDNNNNIQNYTRYYNIPELNENTVYNRKGTRYFTSNFLGYTYRNLGSTFNISMSPTFLGQSDASIGRILLYHNTKDIYVLDLGNTSFQGRRFFSNMMTLYILGSDYKLDKIDDEFNNINKGCQVHNISDDCICGFWSGYGTLPEYLINYFFEIANYDKQITINGIIAMDKNFDSLRNSVITGTEYRIFCPDIYMELEAVLYMGNIYTDKKLYESKIKYDMDNYKNKSMIIKKWDNYSIPSIQKQIEEYIKKRNMINPTIFHGGKTNKHFKLKNIKC